MGTLTDQLKKHIDEVGEEQFKKELFVFECKWYSIDPTLKSAKRKLKWKKFKEYTFPIIWKTIIWILLYSLVAMSFTMYGMMSSIVETSTEPITNEWLMHVTFIIGHCIFIYFIYWIKKHDL